MNSTKTTVKPTKAVAAKADVKPVPVPEPVFEVKDDLIEDDYGDEEEEEEEDEAVIAEQEKHMTPAEKEASRAERAKRVKKPALSAKHRNLMAVCHWFVSQLPEEMRTNTDLLSRLLMNADLETQTAFYSQFNAKEEVKIVKNIGKPVKVPKAKKSVVVAAASAASPSTQEEVMADLNQPQTPLVGTDLRELLNTKVEAPVSEPEVKKTKKVAAKRMVDPETAEKVKVAVGKK